MINLSQERLFRVELGKILFTTISLEAGNVCHHFSQTQSQKGLLKLTYTFSKCIRNNEDEVREELPLSSSLLLKKQQAGRSLIDLKSPIATQRQSQDQNLVLSESKAQPLNCWAMWRARTDVERFMERCQGILFGKKKKKNRLWNSICCISPFI